jgi:hypothetical protein
MKHMGGLSRRASICHWALCKTCASGQTWMDSRMVRTLYAADQCSFKMSRQMLPALSTLGWKHGVSKHTSGASNG